MAIKTGDAIPDLTLPASGGRSIRLGDFADQKLVVYFYPKDDTPGCTLEGQDFTRLYPEFQKAGAEVIGVSKDSVASHDKFCSKYGFNFPLISDTEGAACEAFGTIVEKNLYGKKSMGIGRSTFLFDKGKLVREWRSVKAKEHAEAVLAAVQAL